MPLQSKPQVFPILQLPSELLCLVINSCDMTTLLALRRTSVIFSFHITNILASDRDRLLSHYVPDCHSLKRHLLQARALIGGFSVLSFILRDPSIRPPCLEIFVPASSSELLKRLLCEDTTLLLQLDPSPPTLPPHPSMTLAHITTVTTFNAAHNRFVAIFTSTSETALEPIAASPASAMVNWLSPSAFGCGYPALTLKLQSIVMEPSDYDIPLILLYADLARHGFQISFEPHRFNNWSTRIPPSPIPSQQPCLRRWYLCPDQGRFFGDGGSLVMIIDLLHEDLEQLHVRAPRVAQK
ncbi:hypothetical protein C2E23DRAFT_883187 [Lenzites betulinus]|nr:hypothetical protein C2E23DRAFT_883187 [Lenzites betulinus]